MPVPEKILASARRWAEDAVETVDYDKAAVNAAVQTLDDWFQSNRAAINSAVDAATAPTRLSASVKKQILAAYFNHLAQDR